MKKIVRREPHSMTTGGGDPLVEIWLSCGHGLICRTAPNQRLLKAGMPDDSWIAPEATVANCPICLD